MFKRLKKCSFHLKASRELMKLIYAKAGNIRCIYLSQFKTISTSFMVS